MAHRQITQSIARALQLAGIVLLIPALPSLLGPLLGLFIALMTLRGEVFFICLLPLIAGGFGIALLVGYGRRAGGTLTKDKWTLLWGASFVFNFLPFFVGLLWLGKAYYGAPNATGREISDLGAFLLGIPICWWGVASFLSGYAFYKDA